MAPPFRVRGCVPTDLAFVVSSLAGGLLDAPAGKGRTKRELVPEADVFVRGHRVMGARLVVAHDAEHESVLFGWALAAPPVLHWVYVRAAFRGEGIARALLDELGELRSYSLAPPSKALRGSLAQALRYAPLATVPRAA